MANKTRRARIALTEHDVRIIWDRLLRGDFQHDIAAAFGVNQGRISEIKTGRRYTHITGAPANDNA